MFDSYSKAYESVRMSRHDGILEVEFHTNGNSLIWGALPHRELPAAFADIAADRENRIVILTGAGADFCAVRDESLSKTRDSPLGFDVIYWEGKKLLEALLSIEVPVIAAVNGPARYHAELAVLSDIVLASTTALFQDKPHFPSGVVPGDGVQFVWQGLLGVNRGRYFLLTGQELSADEALQLGVVSEVLAPGDLLPRARALAKQFSAKSDLTLRYTRIALVQHLRRQVLLDLGYGLALEGLALMREPDARAVDTSPK
ncbi:MAG: enoyl-CoA hydratase/isomerase family protein [Sphingorhabdus sp.]